MVEPAGILATEKAVKLLKHFYAAPEIQMIGYIIKFLEKEAGSSLDYRVVSKLVRCRKILEKETNHYLAIEIVKKDIPIPSYCFGCKKVHCENCGGVLEK